MKRLFLTLSVITAVALISCKEEDLVVVEQQDKLATVSSEEVVASLSRDISMYKGVIKLSKSNAIHSNCRQAIEDGYIRLQAHSQLVDDARLREQVDMAFEDLVPLVPSSNIEKQLVEEITAFLLRSFADDMVRPGASIPQLVLDYDAAIGRNTYLKGSGSEKYFSQVVATFADAIIYAETMGVAEFERDFERCIRRKMNQKNAVEMAEFIVGLPASFVWLTASCVYEVA